METYKFADMEQAAQDMQAGRTIKPVIVFERDVYAGEDIVYQVHEKLFLGGTWTSPSSSRTIEVISASTAEPIGKVPEAGEEDVDIAVESARRAFDDPKGWASWEPEERAVALERFAVALEARSDEFVRLVSSQNGMPVAIGNPTEGSSPAMLVRYYAQLAVNQEVEQARPALGGGTTVIRHEPVGVVAGIVPWNFPQSLTFFKLAPALAAGCTVVIKPSPETVLDAFLLAEAVEAAGLPEGVVSIVPGGRDTGAYLVSHPKVDKVAFTGSTAAGRQIAEVCGRLLRPVTLELGGKSAAIVLDDAELADKMDRIFGLTLLNNGQACFLCTRWLVPRSRYDEVVGTLAALAGALTVGDPLDPTTQIGPLVSERQRDRVESYIAKGKGEGARVVAGGGRPEGLDRGWYVQPTVFADVDNGSTIAQEEIFGPVLSIIPYRDVDEAVAIANHSDYGLGGSVWSADPQRARAVAARVKTGSIGINSYVIDPGAPFGGVKGSGIGRELGADGLTNNQVVKSIYLET